VHSVKASQSLSLIDYSEQTGHGQVNLFQIILAEVDLTQLFAHQEVRLKFVLLLEQYIPQLVEVVVIFQTELLCAPRSTIFRVLPLIVVLTAPSLHVLSLAGLCIHAQLLHATLRTRNHGDSFLKVVPVDTHFLDG